MGCPMSYEPPLNDPVFYAEEGEEEIKCFICGDPLDQDDIVWANVEGQIIKEGNETPWCVACLPSEVISKWEKVNCKSDNCTNQVDTFYYCDDHFEEGEQ